MNLKFTKAPVIRDIIWDNKIFIIPFVLFIAISLILLEIQGNAHLYLHVNRHYTVFADYLFLYLTNLGDGIIAAILVIVLLWVSFRESLTFLTITLLLAIVVTVLKNNIFPELDRPVAYFGSSEVLRLVAGYDPPVLGTFPSGHTATAFSVSLYLALLIKNRFVKFILFFIAFSVGYSRIYLSAHFPADVVAGSSIAVIFTILCYYWSRRIKSSWLDKKIEFVPKIFSRQQTT